MVFGWPFSFAFSSFEASPADPNQHRFELMIGDIEKYDTLDGNKFRPKLEQNIVLELFTSFFLRLVAEASRQRISDLVTSPSPDDACDKLAAILLKHGVCISKQQARLAIVPALILTGNLSTWPAGYKPPPPPVVVDENGRTAFPWDHKDVVIHPHWDNPNDAGIHLAPLDDDSDKGRAPSLPRGSTESDFIDSSLYRHGVWGNFEDVLIRKSESCLLRSSTVLFLPIFEITHEGREWIVLLGLQKPLQNFQRVKDSGEESSWFQEGQGFAIATENEGRWGNLGTKLQAPA
ncbi:hypothetical protein QBC47DRAFT_460531 [Echria macrotheca]|uniref:Uncharacterized protein n=1 Tax=Echria macrotheca TaxID=438768 RepID=A0AAJ0F5B1_9PEZI|nr:hypothetical protein QBC47DRAFT_460531 [Echria macrotheca]